MLRNLQSAVALLTCGCMVGYAAVPVSIGILVTDTPAVVDGIPIRGNSTLFSGNVVNAASAASSLWFSDGSSLVLQPGARVRVFRDHSVLEQGVATQTGSSKRELIVDGLTVASLSGRGAVAASWHDNSHFEAMAENGPAEVRTPLGELVARLNPGERLTFTSIVPSPAQQEAPPPPTGPPITVRGILRQEPEGEFKITNDADGEEYIVEGDIPGNALGASVQLRGNSAGIATNVMCHTPAAQGGSAPCQIIIAHLIRVLAAGSNKQGGPNQEVAKQTAPKPKAPIQKGPNPEGPNQEGPNPEGPNQQGSKQEASKREGPKEEGQAPTPTAESSRWHSGTLIIIAAVAGGGALVAVLALGSGKGSTPSTSAP
jgi:hypothetical protein